MPKPRIFIDGEHGTTGLQIRQRLAERGDIELLSIPVERRKDADARSDLLNEADIAILCLPDDAARESAALVAGGSTRLIDASSAHRTAEGWVYGLPELDPAQRDDVRSARRVSNPGCWPQGPIAMLAPLVASGLLPADLPITVNGISGYSGGGRQMVEEYEAAGQGASVFMPYALTLKHKHVPELRRYAGLRTDPMMQPAVGNFAQGMLSIVPLQLGALDRVPKGADLHAALADHYAAQAGGVITVAPFETIERTPSLDAASFAGRDDMVIHVFANDDRAQVLLVAAYDNLGKGASGAAVQNMDLMLAA